MDLHGLTVKDNRVVKSTLSFSIPDYMEFQADKNYTAENRARAQEWWRDYAKAFTGSTDSNVNNTFAQKLYANRDQSASLKEIITLPDTLIKDLEDRDKAVGLVNWLGGGGIYTGNWLGNLPAWNNPDDFLNTSKIITEGTVQPWNLADLLIILKAKNPGAHDYILRKGFAKACKIKMADDSGYSVTNNQTVNDLKKSAANLAEEVAKVPKMILDTASNTIEAADTSLSVLGFCIKYWLPISVVVAAGAGYFAWRNREELAKLAVVAAKTAA